MGVPRLLHSYLYSPWVSILMYHGIVQTPLAVDDWCFLGIERFRRQIADLKKHFDVVSLSRVIDLLKANAVKRPTVVITFDDGYQNNYDVAFPVLCEYQVPATIFLTTGLIDSSDTLWFCRLNDALSRTKVKSTSWLGACFSLSTPREKAVASAALQEMLKRCSPARLASALTEICEQLDEVATRPVPEGSPFRMLRSDSIRSMLASGLVEFGGHTHTHTILTKLSREEAEREIVQSLDIVCELTGKRCRFFAYPNGRREDYSHGHVEFLQSYEVEGAVSTIAGHNDAHTPLLELRRCGVRSETGPANFRLMLHHLLSKIERVRK